MGGSKPTSAESLLPCRAYSQEASFDTGSATCLVGLLARAYCPVGFTLKNHYLMEVVPYACYKDTKSEAVQVYSPEYNAYQSPHVHSQVFQIHLQAVQRLKGTWDPPHTHRGGRGEGHLGGACRTDTYMLVYIYVAY